MEILNNYNAFFFDGRVFQHNEEVEGIVLLKEILFCVTAHYLYIWDYQSITILAMILLLKNNTVLDNSTAEEKVKQIIKKIKIRNVIIFGRKKYVVVNDSATIYVYRQKEFLPYLQVDKISYFIENGDRLCRYKDRKEIIGKLPKEYGMCTQIKKYKNNMYISFESGHILSVADIDNININPCNENISLNDLQMIEYSEYYFVSSEPILDFTIDPTIVSYFDRPLTFIHRDIHGVSNISKTRKMNKRCQILKIEKLEQKEKGNLLFIVSSHSNIFLLDYSLRILACKKMYTSFFLLQDIDKDKDKNKAQSLLFATSESGTLLEMSIKYSSS